MSVRTHVADFTARGVPIFEPAFADLQPAPGRRAHGVVTSFSAETWARPLARPLLGLGRPA